VRLDRWVTAVVLDNPANPYFASRQFLTTVSAFPVDDATAGE